MPYRDYTQETVTTRLGWARSGSPQLLYSHVSTRLCTSRYIGYYVFHQCTVIYILCLSGETNGQACLGELLYTYYLSTISITILN